MMAEAIQDNFSPYDSFIKIFSIVFFLIDDGTHCNETVFASTRSLPEKQLDKAPKHLFIPHNNEGQTEFLSFFQLVANVVRTDIAVPFPVALPEPQVVLLATEPLADDEGLLVGLNGNPGATADGHVDSGLS